MNQQFDNIEQRDRERLLEQLGRIARDLAWRIEQQGVDSNGRGPLGSDAMRKRLTFMLRNVKARIAAARAEMEAS